MIRYALKCSNGHRFESWFQSAEAFDKLKSVGLTECPTCADTAITKAIMAPRVRPARSAANAPANAAADVPANTAADAPALSTPTTETEKALAKLKSEIEANSEYVGMNFAEEARAIHQGDTPKRAIYGEAKPEEAKALIEDGVPVAPLPFTPKAKTN